MRTSLVAFTAIASLAAWLGAAIAQSADHPVAASYRPGLGDLMTSTVQPRHIKLARAGKEKNWSYAAYELHELGEAFGRIAQVWPEWRSMPIPDMLHGALDESMANLAQAIKRTDPTAFAAAYSQLTDGCNACHQGANRGFVVIQIPEASSYPDQNFTPNGK